MPAVRTSKTPGLEGVSPAPTGFLIGFCGVVLRSGCCGIAMGLGSRSRERVSEDLEAWADMKEGVKLAVLLPEPFVVVLGDPLVEPLR